MDVKSGLYGESRLLYRCDIQPLQMIAQCKYWLIFYW